MSDIAIRAEGLGKRYHLGGTGERYQTLRDQIGKWLSPRGWARALRRGDARPTFWALKDVSFDVPRGEVVGIIGRNGAGKSTLLKILSRITEPTEGWADIHGRVGSLLEVGTGFNPEFTGRENIFLNGAILGMRRAEIVRKFDAIVGFAEVEKFLDTPVKHYSSGMYMRLAFAVAAHLEPEILVVDEVLAVGDAEFQKKCLGKMGEVARGGRTVLFVSHNMAAVSSLCGRCIYLSEGRVSLIGPTGECISRYYSGFEAPDAEAAGARHRPGSGEARFISVTPGRRQFRPDEPKTVEFAVRGYATDLTRCLLAAHLVDDAERIVCQCNSVFLGTWVALGGGDVSGVLVVRTPWLKPGDYCLDLFLLDGRVGVVDRFEKACRFTVLPIPPYPVPGPEASMTAGAVLADFEWVVNPRGGHG